MRIGFKTLISDQNDRIMSDSAFESQVGGDHYKKCVIQPTEYNVKNNLGFCEGNIVKYITRHQDKNGAEDIKKIIHYCELLLELKYDGYKTKG